MPVGVLGLGPNLPGGAGTVSETDIRVFRDRDTAVHGQDQLVVLPDAQIVDEERRDIEMGDLIHLQAGIVGMPDHQLGLAGAAGEGIPGFCKLSETHLAEPAVRFVRILGCWGGTAARCLHIGLGHVKLAVAQFGDRMHIGVVVDPHAGRDFGDRGVGAEVETRGHRCRILVNHECDGDDVPGIPGRERRAQGDRDDRGVFGAVGHVDGNHAAAVLHRAIVEDVLHQPGPDIVRRFARRLVRRMRRRGCFRAGRRRTELRGG